MVECDAGLDPIANAQCFVENFADIALNDPIAAVFLAIGALLVGASSAVFGVLVAGGLTSAVADLF